MDGHALCEHIHPDYCFLFYNDFGSDVSCNDNINALVKRKFHVVFQIGVCHGSAGYVIYFDVAAYAAQGNSAIDGVYRTGCLYFLQAGSLAYSACVWIVVQDDFVKINVFVLVSCLTREGNQTESLHGSSLQIVAVEVM